MLDFNYKFSTTLLKNINDVERLYGQLEGMQIPQNLLLNLERNNLIASSFASNRIEGNPLSEAEVTNLLLDERIPVNRDEKEVANYFSILQELPSMVSEPITIELVLSLHSKLLNGVNDTIKGKLRNATVVVGHRDFNGNIVVKHNPPVHTTKAIQETLSKLCDWINTAEELAMIQIGLFHHYFVYIHPFEDGNGRVCRLLTALLFLKNQYLINKYFVLDDYYDIDKTLYSDKLHSADNKESTEWLEYFTNGVKYSLQSALGKIENGLNNLTFDIRPSTKEKEVLNHIQKRKEVNSSDIAKEMGISRQQAFNLLKSLIQKGFIEKKGNGKASYYVIK